MSKYLRWHFPYDNPLLWQSVDNITYTSQLKFSLIGIIKTKNPGLCIELSTNNSKLLK